MHDISSIYKYQPSLMNPRDVLHRSKRQNLMLAQLRWATVLPQQTWPKRRGLLCLFPGGKLHCHLWQWWQWIWTNIYCLRWWWEHVIKV